MTRRWLTIMAVLFAVIAWGPEWAGIGAPGLGPMQLAILVIAGVCASLGVLIGRVDGRPLMLGTVLAMGLAAAMAVFSFLDAEPGWLLWRLKTRWTGTTPLELHVEDAMLGWRNDANVSVIDKHYDYEAHYQTDADGFRFSSESVAKQPGATTIVCLGGSFTFGQGVGGAEAYPNQWNARSGRNVRVINAGVNGYGTVQAYLQLTRYLNELPPPDLVTYGFIPAHLERNSNRKHWLEILALSGRSKPIVHLNQDRVVFDRLIDLANAEEISEALREREIAITQACLQQMKIECEQRGSQFWVLYLGDDTSDPATGFKLDAISEFAANNDIQLIDLTPLEARRFVHDGHPTSEWHADVASELIRYWELQNGQ